MIDEWKLLDSWLSEGYSCCLAVVTNTWGSAPLQAGSLMVIREDTVFEGSVSGGCVEGTVITHAATLIENNKKDLSERASTCLTFDVANETAWSVGLACGGKIEIFLVVLPTHLREAVKTVHAGLVNRQTGTLTITSNPVTVSLDPAEPWKGNTRHPGASGHMQTGSHLEISDGGTLSLPIEPPPRLVIVGAVHIAQKLVQIASIAGYECVVCDPRDAFLHERSFSACKTCCMWPDEYFDQYPIDARTAVALLTHDPKIDDIGLLTALRSDAFYIGALGSKKTQQQRQDRLRSQGLGDADLDRLSGPIGLDISAKNPAEIAVAILAEVISAYRAPGLGRDA